MMHILLDCGAVEQALFLQYVDAVSLSWGADTTPVNQKHDHHGRKILQILKPREGNGKPPWLIYPKT